MEFNLSKFMEEQNSINQRVEENTKYISKSNNNNTKAIDFISKQLDVVNKRYEKVIKKVTVLEKENNELSEKQLQLEDGIKKIRDKTDVLEFEDTITLGKLKKEANNRVLHIVGGKDTAEYILFYRSYIAKLYSDISDALSGGKRIGKIRVEDGSAAITMAKRWYPKHTSKLIRELQNLDNKGLLSKEKSNALDSYLDKICE